MRRALCVRIYIRLAEACHGHVDLVLISIVDTDGTNEVSAHDPLEALRTCR